jgi:hypothetical protein
LLLHGLLVDKPWLLLIDKPWLLLGVEPWLLLGRLSGKPWLLHGLLGLLWLLGGEPWLLLGLLSGKPWLLLGIKPCLLLGVEPWLLLGVKPWLLCGKPWLCDEPWLCRVLHCWLGPTWLTIGCSLWPALLLLLLLLSWRYCQGDSSRWALWGPLHWLAIGRCCSGGPLLLLWWLGRGAPRC